MAWMLTVTIFFSLVSLDKAGKLINQNAIHVAPIDKRVSFAPHYIRLDMHQSLTLNIPLTTNPY